MDDGSYGGGWTRKSALVVSANQTSRQNLSEIAMVCGLLPTSHDDYSDWPMADIVIADIRSPIASPALDNISQYLQKHTVPVLAWSNSQDIDPAYAALADADAHWLVDGGDYDALALLATLAYRPKASSVREEGDKVDYAALHRISDELADFAQVLADMAGQRRVAPSPPVPAPVSFRKSATSARAMPLDPAQIRELIRTRRLRDAYFQQGLFGEPAWDILLDLMAAKLERVDVSVSSLCIAAAVPPTTALRCITAMTAGGMLERSADPHDARRIFISLSPGSEAAMRRYLSETLT